MNYTDDQTLFLLKETRKAIRKMNKGGWLKGCDRVAVVFTDEGGIYSRIKKGDPIGPPDFLNQIKQMEKMKSDKNNADLLLTKFRVTKKGVEFIKQELMRVL